MAQEEKQLLLKDLCARLSYRTFAQWHHKALNEFRDVKIMKISTYGKNTDDYYINVLCQPEPGVDYEASIVDIKPYLRPMSSMTEEEKEELYHYYCNEIADNLNTPNLTWELRCCVSNSFGTDWLNAHHFDFRNLIERGLAIDCTNLNIY